MAIRYDKKLNNEIRSIVNKYNAKVRRVAKKNDSNLFVPKQINKEILKSLKESVSTRSDLRRRLKDLESYTERGAERIIKVKGVSIPKYQYSQIKKYRGIVKRKLKTREEFTKQTHATVLGKKDKYTIAEQFDEEYLNVKALQDRLIDVDYLSKSPKQLETYLESLKANAKQQNLTKWQRDYADIILDTAYVYGIPHDKIHELRKKLLNLSPAQFNKLYKTEKTISNIVNYYAKINEIGVDRALEDELDDEKEDSILNTFEGLFDNIDEILKDYK